MPNTNLNGPYPLNADKIDEIITITASGTYVLGYVNSNNVFVVKYVGRSDDDLNDRLHDWIEEYESFKAKTFNTSKEAFEKECRIYHDFGQSSKLDNDIHPARPKDYDWECPICDIFD